MFSNEIRFHEHLTEERNLQLVICLPSLKKEAEAHLIFFNTTYINNYYDFERYFLKLKPTNLPDVLLIEIDPEGKYVDAVEKIHNSFLLKGIIIILLGRDKNMGRVRINMLKVHDIYFTPINYNSLRERIIFLVRFKLIKPRIELLKEDMIIKFDMPVSKRLLDFFFSVTLLLCLLPVFIITALIIRIGSKGPVIYKSKRVGTGYKIFNFYKFRSMRADADKQLAELNKFNQYADESKNEKPAFVKFKNDPRVTAFGRFIRKTSIDELPQLYNILKGDMSVVGNRPLPLYEAEMLTTNDWAMRFMAPAGLTGLWQIKKRGRADMSDRERKKLDNLYAKNFSFMFDMKIIFATIPALFQKEKV